MDSRRWRRSLSHILSLGPAVVMRFRPERPPFLIQGASSALNEIINLDDDLMWADPTSLVVNRICGGGRVRIVGIESWTLRAEDETMAAQLLDNQVNLGLGDADATMSILGVVRQRLALHRDYAIDTDAQIGVALTTYHKGGSLISGTVNFSRCKVLERWPIGDDVPMMVELEGRIAGTAELLDNDTATTSVHEVEATFVMPALVDSTSDALVQTLESSCAGGREAP